MQVLILFSSSELGGAERSLSRMAFAANDIEIKLATIKGEGPWCEWVRSQSVAPIVLGGDEEHGDVGILRAIFRLMKYLRKNPVNILYICGFRASFLLRLLRPFISIDKIIHGVRWNPDSNSRLDRFFRFFEGASSFLIDTWITNSEVSKMTLVKRCRISEDRIFVIYNGIDKLPTSVPPIPTRPIEILTVANLSPRKGHKEFLRIISSVSKCIPECRFVFIGRDDMNGVIQREVEDQGLSDIVHYEGFRADVTPWLRRARLFVLPSLWGEGCPTSIIEAFAFGVPVIAYAIDGIPELVNDGIDGYLFEFGDKNTTHKIVELLQSPDQLEKMGVEGRNKVSDKFVLDACVEKHMFVFNKLLG